MPLSSGSMLDQSTGQTGRLHYYEFGPFHVDVRNQRLLRGGEPVAVTPKAMDLLLLLLQRRDRVVSKSELMRDLWGDTIVEEANLTQQVFTLRKILGESAGGAAYIETVPRRGYRLGADVREVREAPPSSRPGSRRPSRAVLALVLLAVAAGALTARFWPVGPPGEPVMLAVLPFENLSGNASQDQTGGIASGDSLAVGIPDAIITRLSNVRQFRVRPTSAVARYYGQAVDVQDVGRRLGSQFVLAGTVRAIADRVRVSVQLVRTADGSPVWGRQYDSAREDLLGIEDGIAESIASTLQVQMSNAERERLYRRYTRNGAAYERYLMGRAHLRSVTEQGARQAITEFEAAKELDPNYTLAYAGLATAAAQLRVRFASEEGHESWDVRARREAGRALQLDPDLPEAHVAIAAVHRFQEYDWDTVIRESRRAAELNPSLDTPHLYLAAAYFHLGMLEDAEREIVTARELNPENRTEPLEILGAIRLFAGRTADAAGILSQAHDLTDSHIVRYMLGWTLYYQGERQRAEALLQSMIDDEGPVAGNARATLAAIRAKHGARAEARALAEQAASDAELIHHGAYGLGTAYAQLGEPVTAIRWLAQAAATGFPCYPWYERDPLLDPIRDDPRFTTFMRELQRSSEEARAKYAAAPRAPGVTS